MEGDRREPTAVDYEKLAEAARLMNAAFGRLAAAMDEAVKVWNVHMRRVRETFEANMAEIARQAESERAQRLAEGVRRLAEDEDV